MRSLMCCWCRTNSEDLERNVPLLFAGRRNLALGFSNVIDLVFLEGFSTLSDAYRSSLTEVGYTLHDAGDLYRAMENRYDGLRRFSDYERKCFLRWPVLAAYFPGDSILHYDGDMVFNEDPAIIGPLLEGCTFVLQGCPALTAISTTDWFDQYNSELARLSDDVDAYSANAWAERSGWERSETEKWAGQRFRETISHDQDFLSHLIHTDRITQDRPSDVQRNLSSYILFENPLYVHGYGNDLRDARYERVRGIDYLAGKRVLVWHMQADFNLYVSRFIFRTVYLRRSGKRLSQEYGTTDIEDRLLRFFVRRLGGKIQLRIKVYQNIFGDGDFGGLMNDRTWWKEGVFHA
jgi:hypothetical protein